MGSYETDCRRKKHEMKKIIRGLLKIPFTPLVVFWCLFIIVIFNCILFGQWIYESGEFEKEVTQDCINDQYNILKRWFTTI